MSEAAAVITAIRKGKVVVIPTDTVYGLACTPFRPDPVVALAELKRRPAAQPIALVAASVERLFEYLPELHGTAAAMARTLLPGPYTLVLPNPAARFPWLTGARTDTIGVRVPALAGPTAVVLEEVRAVAATSANLHGDPDPRRVEEISSVIREAVTATLDAGELPGTPSTVLDLTRDEPCVVREGAVPAEEALARVAALLSNAQGPESASADSGPREDP